MAKKVLFINQETTPYVTQSQMAEMGGMMPAKMQEAGFEIRTFMPKWSTINERRGQLHEVIRLSGMNLIIDDTDHPLIIKVASIPQSRIQVYFIDNEDYYQNRPAMTKDELATTIPTMASGPSSSPAACWRRSKSSAGRPISFTARAG